MDYLHSHRTTVGLFYPGEMIDLSHCEFSPGPLLIHDRHRQDSNQHEIICALNQRYPTVRKKIIKLWWRRVRCYGPYYINELKAFLFIGFKIYFSNKQQNIWYFGFRL